MPSSPLTKLEHQWVMLEMTPVQIFRKTNGEIIALRDGETTGQIQLGCKLCDAAPEEGWHTVCPGE